MSEAQSVDEPLFTKELEVLRPKRLNDFNGQSAIKSNLEVFIHSARSRNDALDHLLFHGPPGLGKTTLAQIISEELGVNMRQISGPSIQKPSDIVTLLVGLEERDVLFIDEVHRIPANIAEMLYVVMEDYRLDLIVGDQNEGRAVSIALPKFTLIGATTHRGKLPTPLNDRFTIKFGLELYTDEELGLVVERAAKMLNLAVTEGAVSEVVRSSRGTPRIALGTMKRIRDFVLYEGRAIVDQEFARKALDRLGFDKDGLDAIDRKYLKLLKSSIRPIGLKTLAKAINEPEESLEVNVEPYLLRKGLIMLTDRGRVLSKKLRNPFTQSEFGF